MANRPVVGSGPVPYLAASNKFFLIPLSGLSFDDKGVIDSAAWQAAAGLGGDADRLKAVFSDLATRGVLRPGKLSAATLSFKFEAAAAGAGGNGTAVTIAKVKRDTATPPDPTKTQFELTVAETATFKLSYDPAAANTINKVLGSGATTPPPLVKLKADVGASPALPVAGKYALAGGATDVAIPAATGTAFTLTRADAAPTAPAIAVTIGVVDATARTFTLTAVRSLTRTVTVGGVTTVGQPDAEAVKHAVKVSISPATGGGVPSAGTYRLAGGADDATLPAKPAAFTVPAVP
jgi:hypothetical protein